MAVKTFYKEEILSSIFLKYIAIKSYTGRNISVKEPY